MKKVFKIECVSYEMEESSQRACTITNSLGKLIVWHGVGHSENFSAKSYYSHLSTRGIVDLWEKDYGDIGFQRRCHSWPGVLHGEPFWFLIKDSLRKRRYIVVSWCCLFKKYGEDINHPLWYCDYASELWAWYMLSHCAFVK